MTENAFRARDIGLRAQKKILSRMTNKNVVKVFIDDNSASLLDNLYKLAKIHSGNKKEAEKLVKNIIKVIIKLGVLYRNEQFSQEELQAADKFWNKFQLAQMAVISFYEVDFSYDRPYLMNAFNESHQALRFIVQKHLTEKSLSRIDWVFAFFNNAKFLDGLFKKDSEYSETLSKLVADMHKAMDSGDL
ncbi:tumor necrosis factor alpha-induced protein 8-like protein sigmar isoform X2 [Arctopsyche grandis]